MGAAWPRNGAGARGYRDSVIGRWLKERTLLSAQPRQWRSSESGRPAHRRSACRHRCAGRFRSRRAAGGTVRVTFICRALDHWRGTDDHRWRRRHHHTGLSRCRGGRLRALASGAMTIVGRKICLRLGGEKSAEASYRYQLTRVREYGESIALLGWRSGGAGRYSTVRLLRCCGIGAELCHQQHEETPWFRKARPCSPR